MLLARDSRGVFTVLSCAAAGATLGLCEPASAAMMFQLDINSITVEAGEGFDGETHTGTLTLSGDEDSVLQAILIDAFSQDMDASFADLTGEIRLENGDVVGGLIEVTLTDGTGYAALVGGGVGDVDTHSGQGFQVDGLTELGAFDELENGNEFGGVNVTPWMDARGGIIGSFLLFSYEPDGSGIDTDVDLELYLRSVPAPGSVALGALAVGFASRRKRSVA